MTTKTTQLQIRVSVAEKAALRVRADAAGLDVSAYVLARALPAPAQRFAQLLAELAELEDAAESSFTLAALEDLLLPLSAQSFEDAVADAPGIEHCSPVAQNLVAAIVEQAAQLKRVAPPSWTVDVQSLDAPWFATELRSLRPYLIAASPVPFRRRNLFVERGLGARV